MLWDDHVVDGWLDGSALLAERRPDERRGHDVSAHADVVFVV
jgi:hypothetical protein